MLIPARRDVRIAPPAFVETLVPKPPPASTRPLSEVPPSGSVAAGFTESAHAEFLSSRLPPRSKRPRPLLPVIRNSKAFNVAVLNEDASRRVRDLHSIAHGGNNPYYSQFNVQARLGFHRSKQHVNVRLRPIDPVLCVSKGLVLDRRKKKSLAKNATSKASLAQQFDGLGMDGMASPSDSRPRTALPPSEDENACLSEMTFDTMSAVIHEALEEEDVPHVHAMGQESDEELVPLTKDPAPLARPPQKSQPAREHARASAAASIEGGALPGARGVSCGGRAPSTLEPPSKEQAKPRASSSKAGRRAQHSNMGTPLPSPSAAKLLAARPNSGCSLAFATVSELSVAPISEQAQPPSGRPPIGRPHRRVQLLQECSDGGAVAAVAPPPAAAVLTSSSTSDEVRPCDVVKSAPAHSDDAAARFRAVLGGVAQRSVYMKPSVGTWMCPAAARRSAKSQAARPNSGRSPACDIRSEQSVAPSSEAAQPPIGRPPIGRPHRRGQLLQGGDDGDAVAAVASPPAAVALTSSSTSDEVRPCDVALPATAHSDDVAAMSFHAGSGGVAQKNIHAKPSVGTWMCPAAIRRSRACP